MKPSIVIPTYNEMNTITKLIDKVKNSGIEMEKEIIIVDDGSTDKTP